MNYIKPKVKDLNMSEILVENIFISEYMPEADGDFVKAYLLARMYAEIGKEVSDDQMAKRLGITKERLLEAWNYWEEWGLIKKHYIGSQGRMDFGVEFLNLREMLYAQDDADQDEPAREVSIKGESAFGSEAVSELMSKIEGQLGRTLSKTELQHVIEWIEDYKATPEVILKALDYSIKRDKPNFKYIKTVIEGWMAQGLTTSDLIDEYLEAFDQKFVRYKRVLQALGLSRNATEEERRIMDVWFEEQGFNMDKVLEACGKTAGISNPNIKYVSKVLENWKKEAEQDKRDVNDKRPVSNSVLREYYNYLREKADREAEERRTQIYNEIPKIKELDDQMKTIGTQLAKAYLSGDEQEGTRLNALLEQLNVDRAFTLTEKGYDLDYTEPRYGCTECNDTGIAEMGGPCSVCREKRRLEAEVWDRERENKEA